MGKGIRLLCNEYHFVSTTKGRRYHEAIVELEAISEKQMEYFAQEHAKCLEDAWKAQVVFKRVRTGTIAPTSATAQFDVPHGPHNTAPWYLRDRHPLSNDQEFGHAIPVHKCATKPMNTRLG